MELTIMFVASPKNMKTPWASAPHRALTISSQVCVRGALDLSFADNIAKRRTWIVAPEPYQYGPAQGEYVKGVVISNKKGGEGALTGDSVLIRHGTRLKQSGSLYSGHDGVSNFPQKWISRYIPMSKQRQYRWQLNPT